MGTPIASPTHPLAASRRIRSGGSPRQQRNAAYLHYALASGRHPRLAELLSPAGAGPAAPVTDAADRYRDVLGRILTGLLAR